MTCTVMGPALGRWKQKNQTSPRVAAAGRGRERECHDRKPKAFCLTDRNSRKKNEENILKVPAKSMIEENSRGINH